MSFCNRSNHWSERHEAVLKAAARNVLARIGQRNDVTQWDLIDHAWLTVARYCDREKIARQMPFCVKTMMSLATQTRTSLSDRIRRKMPALRVRTVDPDAIELTETIR